MCKNFKISRNYVDILKATCFSPIQATCFSQGLKPVKAWNVKIELVQFAA